MVINKFACFYLNFFFYKNAIYSFIFRKKISQKYKKNSPVMLIWFHKIPFCHLNKRILWKLYLLYIMPGCKDNNSVWGLRPSDGNNRSAMLSGCKDNWSNTSGITSSVILSKFANLSLPIHCTFCSERVLQYYTKTN